MGLATWWSSIGNRIAADPSPQWKAVVWQCQDMCWQHISQMLVSGRFLGLGHLQGLGVNLGRILGVPSIEPFSGGGGVQLDAKAPGIRAPIRTHSSAAVCTQADAVLSCATHIMH